MCDTRTESTSPATTHENLSQVFQNRTPEQEAILSVLELSGTEIRAYIAVVEHPNSKVEHIADVLDRHRRHVARALRELHDVGLVERTEKNFGTGGVGHIYSPIPEQEAEQYFQNQLQNWLDDIDHRIDATLNLFGHSHEGEME